MRLTKWLILLGMFLGLTGCATVSSTPQTESITVTDSRGEVEVPLQPQKVVVFDNGVMDTLRLLGQEDAIIGAVTQNPPAYLADFNQQFENVGTLKEPNLEKLSNLQPDLIIVSNRMADFVEQLETIAPVLWLSTSYDTYWDSVKGNVETLAAIFDVEEKADQLIVETETELADMKTFSQSIDGNALVLLLNEGAISAFSTGSRYGYIFSEFGFQPVEEAIDSSTHGQSIGYEGILAIDPEIIFIIDRSKAIQAEGAESLPLLDNQFIHKTQAYQNNQIISLSPDLWYLSGGGLESIQLMMEEVKGHFE